MFEFSVPETDTRPQRAQSYLLRGDLEKLKRLVDEGFSLSHLGGEQPAYVLAFMYGHKDCVQYLLDQDVRPDETNRGGWTGLHEAAACNAVDVLERMYTILDKHMLFGGRKMPVDIRGKCPVHAAVEKGAVEAAAWLLTPAAEYTPHPNLRDKAGLTPLMIALSNEDAPMVECLLRAGADPLLKNTDGKDAWDLSSEWKECPLPLKQHWVPVTIPGIVETPEAPSASPVSDEGTPSALSSEPTSPKEEDNGLSVFSKRRRQP